MSIKWIFCEHAKGLIKTLQRAVQIAEVSGMEYKSEEAMRDVLRLVTMLGGISQEIDKSTVRSHVGMSPLFDVPEYVPVLFKAQVYHFTILY